MAKRARRTAAIMDLVEVKPNRCHEWAGSRHSFGYGLVVIDQHQILVHRLFYELHNGPIPHGLHVLHRCDNPPCCNPAHLFTGTHTDNMRDMDAKGRNQKRSRNTSDEEYAIAVEMRRNGARQKEIAERLGRSQAQVSAMLLGRFAYATAGRVESARPHHRITFTAEHLEQARAMRAQGATYQQIADAIGYRASSIYIALHKTWRERTPPAIGPKPTLEDNE
jgi:transposase